MLIQPGLRLLLEDIDHINITFLLLLLTYNLMQIPKILNKDYRVKGMNEKSDFVSSPH